MFQSLKERILECIDVLKKAEGVLDEDIVAFRTNRGDETIKTNAYRQIRRFYDYKLSPKLVKVPHKSKEYQRRKAKFGMKNEYWTLVFAGVLYKTLRYKVKNGALYAEYDDSREVVLQALKQRSLLNDLIHPTKKEAKEMAMAYYRSILQKFIEVWQRKK